ncbi:FimV/HubP family polar landmark protein [Pseudoxanthomonas suwonensis]|uniref:FimV/HubP family polar landmark protein n=1 Tax=Pseudoxanthomonas suwonensis TaxID=314722 RepID=UPI0004635911|nr:FimV/HubP family polar landmark protein [Pseudoxanthomonas suwonensis]
MKKRGQGATRPWHWLLALALALPAGNALALGLGQIRVLSAPGQPLLAEIPIISNEPGELENARARLASPETFARVGLQPPTGLVSDLQFEITADAQGRAVLQVTSTRPVDVPVVGFLVEVDWGQGRLVREYSALVNAPQTAAAIEAPVIEAPQAAPSNAIVRAPQVEAPTTPAPAAPVAQPEPVASAPAPQPRSTPRVSAEPGEVLARVERGQTLSHVVAAMDRGGHSFDQAMVALLRANPEAFIGGNIHRIRSGAVLRMPGADDFGLDAAAATALVREHTAQWRQATPIPQPAEAGTATADAAAPRAAPATQAPAAAGQGARLEIAPAVAAAGTQATESGLGAGGEGDMLANEQLRQAQEDLAARDSELQELRSRVEELEKLQQQQSRLIELKDSELAAAQQALAKTNEAGAAGTGGGSPAWLWGGLVLGLVVIGAWWLARRPKPSPIPVQRNGSFDAAALAAAMPQTQQDPVLAADTPDVAHHAHEDAFAAEAAEPELPAWHVDDPAAEVLPINPAPAGRERLELAIAYLDLGDVETARTLLHEVALGHDPSARDEAAQLLREIG